MNAHAINVKRFGGIIDALERENQTLRKLLQTILENEGELDLEPFMASFNAFENAKKFLLNKEAAHELQPSQNANGLKVNRDDLI